jgi:hypothetical protein
LPHQPTWRDTIKLPRQCMWRRRRRPCKPTVPAWRVCRAATCGAATLSCRATRAGVAKRVRSANNIFEVLFLKIKKIKIKKSSASSCYECEYICYCNDKFARESYCMRCVCSDIKPSPILVHTSQSPAQSSSTLRCELFSYIQRDARRDYLNDGGCEFIRAPTADCTVASRSRPRAKPAASSSPVMISQPTTDEWATEQKQYICYPPNNSLLTKHSRQLLANSIQRMITLTVSEFVINAMHDKVKRSRY